MEQRGTRGWKRSPAAGGLPEGVFPAGKATSNQMDQSKAGSAKGAGAGGQVRRDRVAWARK